MVVRELVTLIGFRVDDAALRAAERRIQTVSKNLQRVGKRLTMTVTAPIVGLGIGILKVAGDFQYAMNRVRSLTDATGQDFEKLQKLAKDLGRTTVFSATDAANAMIFLAMAGNDVNEIMSMLPHVLNLATYAGQDLGVTADQVTNMMKGFGVESEKVNEVVDILTYVSRKSNTNVSQLAEGMKYAAPVARMLGLEFKEVAAMAGFMGDAGIQASMMGTTTRQALIKTIRMTPEAEKAFARLGVSYTELTQEGIEQNRNFVDILADLQKAGATAKDLAIIFDQRAISGIAAVLSEGIPELREFIEEIDRFSPGDALKQSKIMMEGFIGAMKRLRSTAQASAIAIAESGFMEWVEKLVQKFADFFENLSKTNPELLRMGTVAALAAAGLGPLLYLVGSLGLALAAISAHPIILVIGALITLMSLFAFFQTKYGKKVKDQLMQKYIIDPSEKRKIEARTTKRLKGMGLSRAQIAGMRRDFSPTYKRILEEETAARTQEIINARTIIDEWNLRQGKPLQYGKMVSPPSGAPPYYELTIHQSNEINVGVNQGIETSKITEMVSAAMDETVQQITADIERNTQPWEQ